MSALSRIPLVGGVIGLLLLTGIPGIAFAHEVYVLDHDTIVNDVAASSPNPFDAYHGNEFRFFFWGFVSLAVVLTIAAASFFHIFERKMSPWLFRLKRFAHPVERITIGLCFIFFGYYSALYGPEIPLDTVFGSITPLMKVVFTVMGVALLLGYYVREIALVAFVIVAVATYEDGWYVLSYTNYLGSLVLLILLGSGGWSLGRTLPETPLAQYMRKRLRPYEHLAFPILRITLGIAVMTAAIYAKFVHSQLALDVVTTYGLTQYFPFDPLFVVLGALIIEVLCGLFLIIGFEVRWVLLFLAFWLTLSLLYFQEHVWPHVVLFGLAISLFCHGYDRYSIEGYFLRQRHREPIL